MVPGACDASSRPLDLAQVMGHSDITVTKLYSHLLPDHLERARNAVNFGSPVGAAELLARRRWGRASRE
jgi:hypothetical protein